MLPFFTEINNGLKQFKLFLRLLNLVVALHELSIIGLKFFKTRRSIGLFKHIRTDKVGKVTKHFQTDCLRKKSECFVGTESEQF